MLGLTLVPVALAVGCNAVTAGSNVGDTCDPTNSDPCGSGLACVAASGCASTICCPPQDPSNPTCFCSVTPAANDDAANDAYSEAAALAVADAETD